jgi:hypothetical protein
MRKTAKAAILYTILEEKSTEKGKEWATNTSGTGTFGTGGREVARTQNTQGRKISLLRRSRQHQRQKRVPICLDVPLVLDTMKDSQAQRGSWNTIWDIPINN